MAKPAFQFRWAGAKQLEKALNELPKATAKSVLRTSLRRVAKPVVADAKRFAPRSDEADKHMADTITVDRVSPRQGGRDPIGGILLGVGPTSDERHAHLVEFGTGPRVTSTGKSTGQMPATPFMRPAWDLNRTQVLRSLRRELWDRLARTAKRLAKRAESGKAIRGLP